MAEWAPPLELEKIDEDIVLKYPCDMRKMFGSKVYFVNENMFTGVYRDYIFLRVSTEMKERLFFEKEWLMPFESKAGRVMREYVTIPGSKARNLKLVEELIEMSFGYVSGLTAKK